MKDGRGSHGTGESWDGGVMGRPRLILVYNWSTIGLQLVYNWSIGTPSGSCAKWIVRKAVAGFGPERYTGDDVAVRDIKNTTTAKYPSRTEFEMQNLQVFLVNLCTRKWLTKF